MLPQAWVWGQVKAETRQILVCEKKIITIKIHYTAFLQYTHFILFLENTIYKI